MGIHRGPNIVKDSLVFGYDTGYGVADNDTATRFYPGEPTENLIYDMSGTVTSSYPEVVYRCTANETNVVDTSAPGGKYSRFTGIDDSSNNQLYSRFSSYSIDVRGDSVNYSVYLKGSGTCHLTVYDNNSGYGTSGTITLTDEWVRYNYTRTVNASATSYWVAVRGVLSTTDVYIAGQQAMRGTHSTPYIENNRSSTQSLIDLKRTTDIDVSNVSFDSTGQPTFDGTNDVINIPNDLGYGTTSVSVFAWYKINGTPANGYHIICGDASLEISIHSSATYIRNGVQTSNGRFVSNNGNQTLNDGNYHYYGFTFDGSTKRAYIDGVQVGTQSVTGTLQTSFSGRKIGAFGGGYYANGDLPVYKVYNKVLTAEEVKQNFNAYKNRFNI